MGELKTLLRAEWSNLDHAMVAAAAILQWRRRFSACEKAGDRQFEHRF